MPCEKKDTKVTITSKSLRITVAGLVLIDAKFQHTISIDDSIWIIGNGRVEGYGSD